MLALLRVGPPIGSARVRPARVGPLCCVPRVCVRARLIATGSLSPRRPASPSGALHVLLSPVPVEPEGEEGPYHAAAQEKLMASALAHSAWVGRAVAPVTVPAPGMEPTPRCPLLEVRLSHARV